PPANAFLDRAWVQKQLEVDATSNLLLLGLTGPAALDSAEAKLAESWQLTDAAIDVESLAGGERELVSRRIFIDEPVVELLDAFEAAPLTGVFTYFVDWIRAEDGAQIPYSMVAAIGPIGRAGDRDDPLVELTAGLEPNGIRLNGWAADDMGALEVGASLDLEYHVVDASRQLVTRTHAFDYAGRAPDVSLDGEGLRSILGTDAGEELMPAFPGLADADSCREWEPGTPVDLDAIRDQDEAYWDEYRGTPKAFVRLDDARELWSSRFGALTGVRFDAEDEDAVVAALRRSLDPASVGLFLRDVRGAAQRASDSPTDFGGLFLGLSFFLIVAALLLTSQLVLFGVEARESQLGLFAALGFTKGRIARILFAEAGIVASVGAVIGVPLGLLYTRGVLAGLASVWSDAVASQSIEYHASPTAALVGSGGALIATLAAIAYGLWRALGRSARALLVSRQGLDAAAEPVDVRRTWIAVAVLAVAAVVIGASVDPAGGPASSSAFFAAGGALLTAGILVVRLALRSQRAVAAPLAGVVPLGITNATRRAGRSLGTVALMAIGTFLVLSVGVNRLGPPQDVYERDSGTGGFAFYGRTSLPLLQDLDTDAGRDFFALDPEDLEGVELVRLRARDGDDASCLNLSRPSTPPLLGVDPHLLAERHAFPFADAMREVDSAWTLLGEALENGAVPAIGDTTSLTWQLKIGVGDTLDYVDERGQPFQVQIVAALADTVLQGDLVIAEAEFERLYPSQGGYRRMLVDVGPDRADEVRGTLTESLEDVGLELEPTGERLQAFHAVQNTYLSIFQVLGALGLLLGSIGLGLVVLRNTQERRGELALMSAVGFSPAGVRRVVLAEYGWLLVAGLAVGVLASLLAVVPLLVSPTSDGSLTRLFLLVGVIGLNGLFWIFVAVRVVADRDPAAGLREQ
ncbi:MAG: ABC transporter permease, partial [Planctomycetota bacterium]